MGSPGEGLSEGGVPGGGQVEGGPDLQVPQRVGVTHPSTVRVVVHLAGE